MAYFQNIPSATFNLSSLISRIALPTFSVLGPKWIENTLNNFLYLLLPFSLSDSPITYFTSTIPLKWLLSILSMEAWNLPNIRIICQYFVYLSAVLDSADHIFFETISSFEDIHFPCSLIIWLLL